MIEAETIDAAVEVAKSWPGVDRGWIAIEVRPVIDAYDPGTHGVGLAGGASG